MKYPETNYIFDVGQDDAALNAAIDHLRSEGFAVLRGAIPKSDVATLKAKVGNILEGPALAGSIGYFMKDPYKKTYDALLLGREAVDVVTCDHLLSMAESVLGGEVVVSEAVMKHDLGSGDLYFPIHVHTGGDRVVKEPGPFGVGSILYLHDTDVGAFCFSAGSQEFIADKGELLTDYPESIRQKIMERMYRIRGLEGDLVVFDERGFHGPEQPVSVSRTVILFGLQRADYFGGKIRCAGPVVLSDIGHLSERQLRVLGLGREFRVPYERFHIHGFGNTRHYGRHKRALEAGFAYDRFKARVRRALGLGRSNEMDV